ncbi:MAG: cell envelope integrity protein TolA [Pseudomonadota bacterium]|nr:cell envelope integrity protein TolA [Pseudomonadota bacterium]
MNAAVLPRDAFAPQQPPGMRSGLVLALIAHALLVAALAWSVAWKTSQPEGIVAELWSALPQIAAPRPAPPLPRPEPPVPKPAPEPRPTPRAAEPTPTPLPDAQIAIERAAREKRLREDAERLDAQRKADAVKREKAEADKRNQAERVAAERTRQRLADEQAEKKKLAEQARQDEARQAAMREANLRRMMRQAGSSDDAAAAGTAARTSGPSAGYAGRIKARIKPNIVLTGNVAGNPLASVEVRLAPDGTIVGRKLVKSSGSPAWDETVIRAIDKTEVLPRDTDGRVPASMTIDFRPQE